MQAPNSLVVSKHARTLAVAVYRLTAAFPSGERFGLTQQMRRAAISIGSNIAEGCGRRGNRELLNFLYIAFGSSSELAFQLEISADLDFGTDERRKEVRAELERLQRMLNRLTAHLRAQTSRQTKRPYPDG